MFKDKIKQLVNESPISKTKLNNWLTNHQLKYSFIMETNSSLKALTLEDIKQLLSKDVLKPTTLKAITTISKSIAFLTLGIIMLNYFPWYLLPIGWAFTAMVASGVSKFDSLLALCSWICMQTKQFLFQ